MAATAISSSSSSPDQSSQTVISPRPRSLQELVQAASYTFDLRSSLTSYVRGVETLRRQALVYESEGDLETAFILLTRCAKLALEDVPKHREFGQADKALSKQLIKTSQMAMDSLKRLKPILKGRYDNWQSLQLSNTESQLHSTSLVVEPLKEYYGDEEARLGIPGRIRRQSDLNLSECPQPSTEPLSFSRSSKRANEAGPSILHPRSHLGTPATASISLHSTEQSLYQGPMPLRLPAFQALVDHRARVPTSYASSPFYTPFLPYSPLPPESQDILSYPTNNVQYLEKSGQPAQYPLLNELRKRPRRPLPQPTSEDLAQLHRESAINLHPRPPTFEPTQSSIALSQGCSDVDTSQLSAAQLRQSSRRSELGGTSSQVYTSRPALKGEASRLRVMARTEAGLPLRDLVLPAEIIDAFATFASRNTARNIETCGLIMGTLAHNTFTGTLLCIPKQSGTSDTCTTRNEEDIFRVTESKNVLVLGWIHTHPRQSCFLSSLDLHTHYSYQQMLPEAVAIVLAPSASPSIGIFRMTDPPGLSIIGSCSDKALFHPHVNAPIYTDARGYHVRITKGLRLDVIDIR